MPPSRVTLGSVAFAALALVMVPALGAAGAFPEDEVTAFTDRHCSSCHNDVDKEAGLDLTSLKYDPSDAANFLTWVKVHDRVQTGEMPPPDKRQPDPAATATFTRGVAASLITHEKAYTARDGRATQRRLNRFEYEYALRDLLHAPWLLVRDQLPEDGEAHRYNKVGDALEVSYVQMARYMSAAKYAINEVIKEKLLQTGPTTRRFYARDQGSLNRGFNSDGLGLSFTDRATTPLVGFEPEPDVRARRAPLTVGDADPVRRELEAVGWAHGHYSTGFSSPFSEYQAPVPGRYKIRFSGYTIWVGPYGHPQPFNNNRVVGHPSAVRWSLPNFDDISQGRNPEPIAVSTQSTLMNRRLGSFDLTPEPTVHDLGEVDLMTGDIIVIDAARLFKSRPTVTRGLWTNPLAQRDGQPGVAFRWMEVEGPLPDPSVGTGYRLLFGDLPINRLDRTVAAAAGGRGRGGRGGPPPEPRYEIVSQNPQQDAERLLRSFMQRAFRGPLEESKVQRYLGLFKSEMETGHTFTEALISAYTGVLASPSFVFVNEKPGPLDDYALATRLALFLWNSEPDEVLRGLAARGELRQPAVLKAQTERMLLDGKSERFLESFTDYWLDIRKMEETTPSITLYNDYNLDFMLADAALDETRLFVGDMLRRDLPARTIVDSDFTYLNERLAQHYGIPGVEGIAMRRVALPAGSPRGGLMTQASVLKITANGTTTSPVLRGVWITERIIGDPVPPPPASVPAVEPDTRGAVTIREQLAKHSADESCAGCHRKMDAPGFALESFDVMGGWRERYRAASMEVPPVFGFGRNGHPFAFHYAQEVDASGALADGRPFADVREFKQLLLADESRIARNIARQLVIYATGAPVRFSDREAVDRIVNEAKPSEYGFRTLVHGVVQSDLFRNK